MLRQQKSFSLVAPYQPTGDQPLAIEKLVKGIKNNQKSQVLLGVTGSGKTFTMANIIAQVNKPTLILAHNKTLVAQLYEEVKAFFPHNAVEYFVSYYDYYQPEAYVPSSDTFIEKDSQINDTIDRMRHRATTSLLSRNDVIIVASVSCIYGIGSTESYQNMTVYLEINQKIRRDSLLRNLVESQYQRNEFEFSRGTFRAKGDIVEVFLPQEEYSALRIEFFGDEIEKLSIIDPLSNKTIKNIQSITIFPASHYATTKERLDKAIKSIKEELYEELIKLKKQDRILHMQRLEQRTLFDLEMLEVSGVCKGIENYSRHLAGSNPGDPPPTLMDYFPKDFLLFVDESHQTIPQIRGMYKGDRARKETLVEHGFRLPSALDNRPLRFDEFNACLNQTIYVSATPQDYEIESSHGEVIEQIIRPTFLLDPVVTIRPVAHQVDDIIKECKNAVNNKERVLITTLTKKMAEDLSDYLSDIGIKARYLHSDIDTIERSEILRALRLGVFDVLIGINLLREGLDLPEVALVGILDADKEGFLRSATGLIQTIGRAARNTEGRAILYADKITDSIEKAISETKRRRLLQEEYNHKNNLIPKQVSRSIGKLDEGFTENKDTESNNKVDYNFHSVKDIEKKILSLNGKMRMLSQKLKFEEAAMIRDEIKHLKQLMLGLE